MGRLDGQRLYGPLRHGPHYVDAVLASQQFRSATDETRRLYRFAFKEGWTAAAAGAAPQTKEKP